MILLITLINDVNGIHFEMIVKSNINKQKTTI